MGINGEMFLGALIDLGASPSRISNAIRVVKETVKACQEVRLLIHDVWRKEIRAKEARIEVREVRRPRKAGEVVGDLHACLANLDLPEKNLVFPVNVFNTVVSAEMKVHGKGISDILLHELASSAVLAQLVAISIALNDLSLPDGKVLSTPVAVGGGYVNTAHGLLSVPTPATLEILRSKEIPMSGGPVKHELTTPLGASILANLVDEFTDVLPPLKPLAVGYGAGRVDFKDFPFVLRLIVGKPRKVSKAMEEDNQG
jgi:hypothetical protein